MSTIKKKFNIGTIAMFLWCLVLATLITQPILARADNEWGNIIIDTSFSPSRSISVEDLSASRIMMWEWWLCNNSESCAKISGDILYVDKIRIWNGDDDDQSTILISWGFLYFTNTFGPQEFPLNSFDDVFSYITFKNYFASKLGNLNDGWQYYIDFTPRWEEAWILFEGNNARRDCNEETAGSLYYEEDNSWSKLIMCMKINANEYSGVVLKGFDGWNDVSRD